MPSRSASRSDWLPGAHGHASSRPTALAETKRGRHSAATGMTRGRSERQSHARVHGEAAGAGRAARGAPFGQSEARARRRDRRRAQALGPADPVPQRRGHAHARGDERLRHARAARGDHRDRGGRVLPQVERPRDHRGRPRHAGGGAGDRADRLCRGQAERSAVAHLLGARCGALYHRRHVPRPGARHRGAEPLVPPLHVCDQELRCRLAPRHHLTLYHEKAEQRGAYLEAAILLGPPPHTFLTAAAPLPYDADEMEVAATLRGAPIAMRPCRHVDLMVPASTEIVIEGRLVPN